MSLRGRVSTEAISYIMKNIDIAAFTVVPPHALLGALTLHNDKAILDSPIKSGNDRRGDVDSYPRDCRNVFERE